MKLVIALLLLSTNAFAMHAYRSEDCKSKTLSLRYTGNYPIGGDYAIGRLDAGQNEYGQIKGELKAYQPGIEEDEAGSDVIYTVVKSVAGKSVDTSADGFDHSEWKSRQLIKVAWLTKQASALLKIKKGDLIAFSCVETSDIPNGKE